LNILLATYSYYPYNWGGTEVYISGLVAYLQEEGHTVTIIAGMPPHAFKDHPVFYEDDQLKTIKYCHGNISIIGVVLKDETTLEVYKKFRKAWIKSWQNILNKHSGAPWDILHTHANTSAMGEALMDAAQVISPKMKIVASYHVPISCVKGTLLFGNSMHACSVTPAKNICTACFISSKQNLPLPFTRLVTGLMPAFKYEKLPTGLKLKYLVTEFIKSFHSFDRKVDQWHVFSEQIKQILFLNRVEEEKVLLLRHGVNPVFYVQNSESISARQNSTPTIFLYAGRLDKVKGFFTLLKAWGKRPQSSQRELWVIGEMQGNDHEVAAWQKSVAQRTDIKWLGGKEQDELAGIMKEVHCTIIPSEWVEIGPLIFHEAIAAGSDVIASDLGGCRELAEIYKLKSNLFEAGNSTELSNKITGFEYSGESESVASRMTNYEMVLKSYLQLKS
jgi:glycosyltransferase involved in cell wall biosynthesis